MSAPQNWTQPADATAYFNQQEKRLGMEERRPRINKASDLLGPLANPTSIIITSLDDPATYFNGSFVLAPGDTTSPDPLKWWIGDTIVNSAEGGVQRLTTFKSEDFPHLVYQRSFVYAPDGVTRYFSSWQLLNPTSITGAGRWNTTYLNLTSNTVDVKATGFSQLFTSPLWTLSSDTWTFVVPGIYMLNCQMAFQAQSAGQRHFTARKNGVSLEGSGSLNNHAEGRVQASSVTTTDVMDAGDTIEFWMYQNSGAALDVTINVGITYICPPP